ncbi:hypothetical protein B7486_11880 [cyanobacterium TDX16]|nr:hypothetical protein B7486_11880 [cyanobacterium TDX16]
MSNESTPVEKPDDAVADARHSAPGATFWILMVLSLLSVGGLALLKFLQTDRDKLHKIAAEQREPIPVLNTLPDFTLTERSGKPVALADLRGRVWVADFIFTHCAGPCPVMSMRMKQFQDLLKKERMDDVVCVSFSVDPENDTPARLTEYADALGAEVGRWLFLTGEKRAIRDLAIKGFKIAVQDPEQGDDQIIHSTRFVLVDREGRIRGYYSAMTESEEIDPQTAGTEGGFPAEARSKLLSDIRRIRRGDN